MKLTGQIVASWHVFCNLCPTFLPYGGKRTNSQRVVEAYIRDMGWRSSTSMIMGKRVRLWTCPECAKTNANFLKRCKQYAK